jgi:hypothetical protein
MTMTERERYKATLLFQKTDRVPFDPGDGRESTLAAWHTQGLPPEVTDYKAYVCDLLGIPAEARPSTARIDPGVSFRMIPEFGEKVIEKREGSLVVQDWKGNICEISDRYDLRYLRKPLDFVTRRWIKCPVESRADWEEMRNRYQPEDPRRFPADFLERARQLRDRTYPSCLWDFPGPFWQLREWLGFEQLCMLFLDDPGWVREMIDFWHEFVAHVLDRMLQHYVPDLIMVSEDMAYKLKAMISPEMCRRFLLPCWRHWAEICRDAGVPILAIDCDGYVGELLPLWIEAGFVCNFPMEVAAGNDLPAARREYGTKMAFLGGVDKRAMAKGGGFLRDEIDRLRPVIESGGYIPGCDHGIPADVPWPSFVEYCRLLAKATGWL